VNSSMASRIRGTPPINDFVWVHSTATGVD
jgi:hypothetical protein